MTNAKPKGRWTTVRGLLLTLTVVVPLCLELMEAFGERAVSADEPASPPSGPSQAREDEAAPPAPAADSVVVSAGEVVVYSDEHPTGSFHHGADAD